MVNKPAAEEAVTTANPPDPSPNVLDIVRAESKYQDGMRDAGDRLGVASREAMDTFQNYARESESRIQNWMREAEAERVDQLAAQRQLFETKIESMLAASVTEKSNLVAQQLLQIQSSFGERVSKLEEFRLTTIGRSSVADPQIAASFDMINRNLSSTQEQFAKSLNDISGKMEVMAKAIIALQDSGTSVSSRDTGRQQVVAWVVAAVSFAATIALAVTAVASHFMR